MIEFTISGFPALGLVTASYILYTEYIVSAFEYMMACTLAERAKDLVLVSFQRLGIEIQRCRNVCGALTS